MKPNTDMSRKIDSFDLFELFRLFMKDVNDDFVEVESLFRIVLGGGLSIELEGNCEYFIDYSTGHFYAKTENEHYIRLGCFSLRPEHYSLQNIHVSRLIAAQGSREQCLKLLHSNDALILFFIANNKNLTLEDYAALFEQKQVIADYAYDLHIAKIFFAKILSVLFDKSNFPYMQKTLKKLCANPGIKNQFYNMLEYKLTERE